MLTLNHNILNLIWVLKEKIFFSKKLQVANVFNCHREVFLTGIYNMCYLSSIPVTVCTIYLVGNEWEKDTVVFLQFGY